MVSSALPKALIHFFFYGWVLSFSFQATAQVNSPRLVCDCLNYSAVTKQCNRQAKIPFTVQFNGARAVLRMRGHDYQLTFKDTFVDPTGFRNSEYVRKGELLVVTTFPLAENWVSVLTESSGYPGAVEITAAFCR